MSVMVFALLSPPPVYSADDGDVLTEPVFPSLSVVHNTALSEKFRDSLDSLMTDYYVLVNDVDYETFPPGENSDYYPEYRKYLNDSRVTLVFEDPESSEIGVKTGEMSEREIIAFFKEHGFSLKTASDW
jgi:hypothetical protein